MVDFEASVLIGLLAKVFANQPIRTRTSKLNIFYVKVSYLFTVSIYIIYLCIYIIHLYNVPLFFSVFTNMPCFLIHNYLIARRMSFLYFSQG